MMRLKRKLQEKANVRESFQGGWRIINIRKINYIYLVMHCLSYIFSLLFPLCNKNKIKIKFLFIGYPWFVLIEKPNKIFIHWISLIVIFKLIPWFSFIYSCIEPFLNTSMPVQQILGYIFIKETQPTMINTLTIVPNYTCAYRTLLD